MKPICLVDSNVMVAALIEDHPGRPATRGFLERLSAGQAVGAAHSFAETYNTLTRENASAQYRVKPAVAWAAIDRLRRTIRPVGLSADETLEAIRAYAGVGGIGPRLYDRLIGEVAVRAGIGTIVTWNVGHFQGLFPGLRIETPGTFGAG